LVGLKSEGVNEGKEKEVREAIERKKRQAAAAVATTSETS
jgi:hypothetical protein